MDRIAKPLKPVSSSECNAVLSESLTMYHTLTRERLTVLLVREPLELERSSRLSATWYIGLQPLAHRVAAFGT